MSLYGSVGETVEHRISPEEQKEGGPEKSYESSSDVKIRTMMTTHFCYIGSCWDNVKNYHDIPPLN